jgi:hypothetical protein
MPRPDEILDELEAVDATLAGEPVDPAYADVAELALLLASERPVPRPEFARDLDARVTGELLAQVRRERLVRLERRHLRAALRRELGAGLGLRGRLTSLWALPPQPREVLDALRPRRRRSYTA